MTVAKSSFDDIAIGYVLPVCGYCHFCIMGRHSTAKYCDQYVYLSVCRSVHLHNSITTWPNFVQPSTSKSSHVGRCELAVSHLLDGVID